MRKKSKMTVEKSAFLKSNQFPLQGQNYDLIQESVSLDEVATLQGGVAIIFCFVEAAGLVKSPCPPMFFGLAVVLYLISQSISL